MKELLDGLLDLQGLKSGTLPTKGRCLFAAKHFSRGEVVIEQGPYVAVLNSYKDKRCDGCYKEGSNLKRCASCKSVWYCSISCQKREWNIHKYECKCLVRLMEEKGRELTPSLRLMLRLLIKRFLQNDKVVPPNPMDNYQVVEALPTHSEETSEQQLILYAQMANLVKSIYIYEDADVKDITHNFCRFACNAHTVCDSELRPLGVGLYPVISIINHSCHPNCVLLFEGKTASVRSVEPIKEGTEVTLSYVELGVNTATRLRSLKEQYFFDCRCLRCLHQVYYDGMLEDDLSQGFMCLNSNCKGLLLSESEDPEKMLCQVCGKKNQKINLLRRINESDACLVEALKLLSGGKLQEARHAFERLDHLQSQMFQQKSLHRMRTYENLLKVCMAMKDWPSSLYYCHRSILAYERVYMPYHPLLGLQLYTRGKLE